MCNDLLLRWWDGADDERNVVKSKWDGLDEEEETALIDVYKCFGFVSFDDMRKDILRINLRSVTEIALVGMNGLVRRESSLLNKYDDDLLRCLNVRFSLIGCFVFDNAVDSEMLRCVVVICFVDGM